MDADFIKKQTVIVKMPKSLSPMFTRHSVMLCQLCQNQLWHTEAAASAIMPYPFKIWHGTAACIQTPPTNTMNTDPQLELLPAPLTWLEKIRRRIFNRKPEPVRQCSNCQHFIEVPVFHNAGLCPIWGLWFDQRLFPLAVRPTCSCGRWQQRQPKSPPAASTARQWAS